MLKIKTTIILLLTFLSSANAYAGEWCCDDPIGVITEKTDPKENCMNMGRWNGLQRKEDYLSCALDDIFHWLSYPFVGSNPPADRIQPYNDTISAIPILYEQYPNLRPKIREGLLKSLAYLDRTNRSVFNNLMEKTSDEFLWQTFISAVDGKEGGKARVFYQFCPNYIHVVEYTVNVHDPSLDEIIEGQEFPELDAMEGTIRCVNAQANIYKKIEKIILEDGLLKTSYLGLLESQRILKIRNTIYAKHGKTFNDKNIADFFKKKDWYKINKAYSDSLLTFNDKTNLTIIKTLGKNHKTKK